MKQAFGSKSLGCKTNKPQGETKRSCKKAAMYVLAAGGTGGHLFPAISLAAELRRRGGIVILFTDERAAKWVDHSCFDRVIVSRFRSQKMSRGIGRAYFVKGLLFCGIKSLFFFLRKRPAAVIGFGGYPSAPTVFAAQLLWIQSILHECNVLMGRANKVLARSATVITTGFCEIAEVPDNRKCIFTGNPVREEIAQLVNRPYVPPYVQSSILLAIQSEESSVSSFAQPLVQPSAPSSSSAPSSLPQLSHSCVRIFIVGGSQGTSLFANVVPYAIQELSKTVNVYITMQVREAESARVEALYKRMGVNAKLAPFFDNIVEILAKSHIIVSRSGAISLAEIAAAGIPSVLVPLGRSRDGDQLYNAAHFEAAGAAVLIEEQSFSPDTLAEVLLELCQNDTVLRDMSRAARELFVLNSAEKLADIVMS
jgi:UDP-N-acetylglucosamine--N-acetylmuramyl-(pentapeptide) pyrophosphoryl-undecaprenol N-acetylglucosamine transferase